MRGPQARGGARARLRGEERRAEAEVLEVLEEDGGVVGGPGAVAQRGEGAEGVGFEEGGGLLGRVDLDVLVGDVLGLEGDPDALHVGAAAGAEELEVLLLGAFAGRREGCAGGFAGEGFLGGSVLEGCDGWRWW